MKRNPVLRILANGLFFALALMAMPALATAEKNVGISVLPVITSLLLVIVAIFVVALIYKKLNLGFPGNRSIKIVSALSLGTRERIVVIEVNGKQHLLGVTNQQVNHLFSLDEPLQEADKSQQTPLTFQKILENLGKKND